MRINDPALIANLRRSKQGNSLLRDGSFYYVVFLEPVRMRLIVRHDQERFSATLARRAKSFDVVVNGNFFGTSKMNQFYAGLGQPISPSEMTVMGRVVLGGKVIAGDSRPERFYLAEVMNAAAKATLRAKAKATTPSRNWHYEVGRGDPPTGKQVVSAIGNLGPLIAGNLPYGIGNRYQRASGSARGDPGFALRPYLTQCNDRLTADVASREPTLGKTIVAHHRATDALLVGVQPTGVSPGQGSLWLRDALRTAGFSDALFADGSSSSMLWYKGRCIVPSSTYKDDMMMVGLGFAQMALPMPPAPPAKKPGR